MEVEDYVTSGQDYKFEDYISPTLDYLKGRVFSFMQGQEYTI